jgi:hypothetical protein
MMRWTVGAAGLFMLWAVWERLWIGWQLPGWAELPVIGLTLCLPTALVGALINRWWAPTMVVSILALPLVPVHCVTHRSSLSSACTGSGDALPWMFSFAFGALIAGTVLAAARHWGTDRRTRASAQLASDADVRLR